MTAGCICCVLILSMGLSNGMIYVECNNVRSRYET